METVQDLAKPLWCFFLHQMWNACKSVDFNEAKMPEPWTCITLYGCLCYLRSAALRCVFVMLVMVWLTAVVDTFISFLPITYGFSSLSHAELQRLKWKPTWDFLWSNKHQ